MAAARSAANRTGNQIRAAIVALLLASGVARAAAQPAAECPQPPCATADTAAARQLWIDAAQVHRLKLQFVDGLQRFTRAQAGAW